MNQAFCHNCQIFLDTVYDYCWKCNDKLEILNVINPVNSENKPIIANQQQFSQNDEVHQTPNNWTNPAHSSNDQEPVFETGGYRNIQANSAANNPEFEKSNFSTVIKPALLSLIVLVGLGFFCTYTKAYFAGLPDQKAREIGEAKFTTGKPQIPWFSSWFRSQPTAEEVFEHFEDVTASKGKTLVSQTMVVKGNIQFSFPNAELEKTYKELRSGALTNSFPVFAPVSNPFSKPKSEIWDFDIEMEMSMKAPNKMLLSMTMTPKDTNIKNVKLYSWSGSNGDEKWVVNKAFINGDQRQSENEVNTLPGLFSNDNDSLTTTFVKEEYQKIEYIGVEAIAERKHYFIKATKPNGQMDSLYFDIETGLVNKVVGKDGDVYIVGYSDMNGVKMPTKLLVKAGNGLIMMTFSEIRKDVPLDDSIFLKTSHQ